MGHINLKNTFPKSTKSFHNKIGYTLNNLPDKKEREQMNRKRLFKKSFAVLAAVVVLSTTVYATVNMIITSHISVSSSKPTYTKMVTSEQMKKDFGFTANLLENFENGYTFKNGGIINNKGLDENGHTMIEYKELNMAYEKEDKRASLSVNNTLVDEEMEEILTTTYEDIKLYYKEITFKHVPSDYKMTKQDKEDEATGKYIFGFGSSEISIQQTQFLHWSMDSLNFLILVSDDGLVKDDMIAMAKELIDYNI